jgi:hypothetical protein
MAKIKMAGKKNVAVHGQVQKSGMTITTLPAIWQALWAPNMPIQVKTSWAGG